MRILVIGSSGTIGSEVVKELVKRHEVVRAARRGEVRVDLADVASIDAMFAAVGQVDAVISCAASGALAALASSSDVDYWRGLDGKLVGQVNLLRRALPYVRDGGSVTLTSGRLSEPIPGGSLTYLVNSGLDAFVGAASIEMPRGIRLNVISPGWVRETLIALEMDPSIGTPVAEVARGYVRTVEGSNHGEVVRV
ncbi:short chain dehydrogenase [Kribbella kalugense]|uniref:NAD(P)-dependent dehydrogenase (Short-subunit alcohol dehydrogenase family) n=1 Tax=Kribbella kalugense TaxID=2512221 RepID=A0A4R7ZYZ0_9ACTN|nr:short chain dehydrogenase [Kribbella kalugense]TDW23423.1 NAD(P)-dependent dehydrogenase (short-subunit alcohol dehydrogenase family) [Kribbella kalugense]